MSVGSSPIFRQFFFKYIVFLKLDFLLLIPAIGVLFITIIPKDLELIFLKRLKLNTLLSKSWSANYLLFQEINFYYSFPAVLLTGYFFVIHHFLFIQMHLFWYFLLKNYYYFQNQGYMLVYTFFILTGEELKKNILKMVHDAVSFKKFSFYKAIFIYLFKFFIFLIAYAVVFLSRVSLGSSYLHQKLAIFFTFITFCYSLCFLYFFEQTSVSYQFLTTFFNLCFLGLDGISLCFLLLSTFLLFFCLLANFSVCFLHSSMINSKLFLNAFLVLEIFLILVFSVLDFFYFYIFFEFLIFPMLFIIGIYGSRSRKIKAMYYFVIYTVFGSLCLLVGFLVYFQNLLFYISQLFGENLISINSQVLATVFETYMVLPFFLFDVLPLHLQLIIWGCLFIGFAVKIPVMPFHLWLPEAHVEAPAAGSMILAGILLKLGGYGFIRFLIPLTAGFFYQIAPVLFTFIFLSIVYGSLVTLRQIDLKRIIAYSSIVHMNVGLLGLFSNSLEGIVGSLILLISHGFVSVGLFYLIGILYERFGSRLLEYYGGLIVLMPDYAFFLFFFVLGNSGFPGTLSFIGEILNFMGIGFYSLLLLFLTCFPSIFFSAVFSFWLYNRLIFGTLKINYLNFSCSFFQKNFKSTQTCDLTLLEKINLGILLILLLGFGCQPNSLLFCLFTSVESYLF